MLIFAHRGASAIEPENTLAAFRAACHANCDGVEFDIHHHDGKLMVIHDRYLERTTSGSGLLTEHSFNNLRQLDAGKGEIIPTLDEVFAVVAKEKLINIELKGVSITDIPLLFDYLDKAKATFSISAKQLLLSSFNHPLLLEIKQQRPEFAIGALTASLPLGNADFAEQLNAISANIVMDYVNKEFVDDAHARGLKVYVYTVDKLPDIKALKRIGVDGIFANNPKQAKKLLSQC